MTPTLLGRWQTRLFMLFLVGGLTTLPFYYINDGNPIFFWILFYVAVFGLGWDIVYHLIQQSLWDGDWPGVLQFASAVIEGVFLALIWANLGLPRVPQTAFQWEWFVAHYSAVWLVTFLLSWVIMRILFPRWRFRGGQWL
ncbi:UNVERIFIED_CONTAM: hypothetical protein BEN50_03270 [Euhalothece sp. KZN 001]